MRYLHFIFLLSLLSLTSFSAPEKEAEMVFKELKFDFGTFSEDKTVEHKFQFENKGNSTLIINQVKAGCGCTIVSYPKKPIIAGSKGEIKVVYNGKNKPLGRFDKYIDVYSNAKVKVITLRISGNMTERE